MKLLCICFTKNGVKTAQKLAKGLENKENIIIDCYAKGTRLEKMELGKIQVLQSSLQEFTKNAFETADAILFIGACGIAVRSIAPFVKSKWEDPAVLVLDEMGNYCISLLSGHVGGANEICQLIAHTIGATPVITTATDLHERFAVDVFAKNNGFLLSDTKLAKEVSAKILMESDTESDTESKIWIYDDLKLIDEKKETEYKEKFLKLGIIYTNDIEKLSHLKENEKEIGIILSMKNGFTFFAKTLYLIPKCLLLGIGAKKGITKTQIEVLFEEIIAEYQLQEKAFDLCASIDLKKEEAGILSFCNEKSLPFMTYQAEELLAVDEVYEFAFSASAFVQSVTGVDTVCERSAIKAAMQKNPLQQPQLLVKKKCKNQVTLAVAYQKPKEILIYRKSEELRYE